MMILPFDFTYLSYLCENSFKDVARVIVSRTSTKERVTNMHRCEIVAKLLHLDHNSQGFFAD